MHIMMQSKAQVYLFSFIIMQTQMIYHCILSTVSSKST